MNIKQKIDDLNRKVSALYLAFKRKDTPWTAKAVIGIAVGYALSPIDLIPDFIPVLGYIDDLVILPLLIALAVKLIPKDIMADCEEKAKDLWKDGKPKKWRYAIPVFVIWALSAGIVLCIIFF